MHCFLPWEHYTDSRHISVVSLMRGEAIKNGIEDIKICTCILTEGAHFYSYTGFKENGAPDFDEEEAITSIEIAKAGNNITIIP